LHLAATGTDELKKLPAAFLAVMEVAEQRIKKKPEQALNRKENKSVTA